jgi:hypothetical protein
MRQIAGKSREETTIRLLKQDRTIQGEYASFFEEVLARIRRYENTSRVGNTHVPKEMVE